ncbi:MAG: IS630 family transposase [bacterium]
MDKTEEVAFYVDEAGPYLVKPQAGQKWYPRDEIFKIPARWKTKGKIVVFGALTTNPGKIHHHINKSKGYKVMLKFIQRLTVLYDQMKTIYLIWDNAKAHEAKRLNNWIDSWNKKGKVRLKVLPLPTYSPWLNPIEPVFGDLYKKVVAGSNFSCPKNMADAIHKYFRHRNWQRRNKDNTLN